MSVAGDIDVAPWAGDDDGWDDFVRAVPGSAFFQRAGWRRVLQREFGFESYDFVARRAGRTVGVLPLSAIGSRRRPVFLSQPFAVEAGVCAVDDEVATALAEHAAALARDRGGARIELRDSFCGAGFVACPGEQAVFRAPLPASDDEHWHRLPRRRRNAIRKARAAGLRVVAGDVESLHDLYARSVRRLGSPAFAPSFFLRLQQEFGDDCVIVRIERGGSPIAAVLAFVHQGVLLPYYAGSHAEAASVAAHDFMYWELMCLARRRGLHGFDFGRSRVGSGAYAYKHLWGFEPTPLHYRWRAAALPLPEGRGGDAGTPWASLRRLWRHVPLPLTKWLGPWLMRHVGVLHT